MSNSVYEYVEYIENSNRYEKAGNFIDAATLVLFTVAFLAFCPVVDKWILIVAAVVSAVVITIASIIRYKCNKKIKELLIAKLQDIEKECECRSGEMGNGMTTILHSMKELDEKQLDERVEEVAEELNLEQKSSEENTNDRGADN